MDCSNFEPLYTAEQTRALDRRAIDGHDVPGITLMARAARAAFDSLLDSWPAPSQLQVLCGTGNNGGDGFLVADLAHKRGIPVIVYQVGDPAKIGGDAALARAQAVANGVAIREFDGALAGEGVVVDALLGTGLGGDVRGAYREAIEAINASGAPVLAVDIPSGLCADTGRVLGAAVCADLTVTFIGLKRGLFTLQAPDHVGALLFADLEVPAAIYDEVPTDTWRLELEPLLETLLPPQPASAHKGLYGTVVVIGGDHGMAGAAALAGEAALRCGAGLVRVATRPEHVAPLVARTPELMPRGIDCGEDAAPLIAAADVLVVGPGLGQSDWSAYLLRAAVASGKPLVLDADALNLLASGAVQAAPAANRVITPHPGEAARLLNCSNAEVQADRFAAARALQRRLGGVAVLKGNGSLVCTGQRLLLSDNGNPGMASGGMGDVLSGVIGALLAQGLAAEDAAALGVCLHGAAGDLAAEDGQRGLLASDLMPWLRALLG